MTEYFLFSRDYPALKGVGFQIDTPKTNYDILIEAITNAGPFSTAVLKLSNPDASLFEQIAVARLYEPLLPQNDYTIDAILVNNDDNLALRVLFDPRVKIT